MNPIFVTLIAVIAAHGLSLATLWLRMRFCIRQEHVRRRYLVAVVRAMPEGSQIYEQRADGTKLVLAVTATHLRERSHG